VKFTPKNLLHAPLAIEYANKLIEGTISTKFWGMPINNHMNWKKCIDICRYSLPKLSTACFAVKRLFHILSIDVLRMVYFVYFHSVTKYGIIFQPIYVVCVHYKIA
jgi:hypothetical protein